LDGEKNTLLQFLVAAGACGNCKRVFFCVRAIHFRFQNIVMIKPIPTTTSTTFQTSLPNEILISG